MGGCLRFALAACAAGLALAPTAAAQVRAGAAAVDASWHVGASAGQYASDGAFGVDPASGTYDPTVHAYRRAWGNRNGAPGARVRAAARS